MMKVALLSDNVCNEQKEIISHLKVLEMSNGIIGVLGEIPIKKIKLIKIFNYCIGICGF